MIYLLDVVGAIGDSLCSEPVLRYAIKHLLRGQDVRIMTNLPRLFKHLGVPMGLTPEELGIRPTDEVCHLFNRPEILDENGDLTFHRIVEFVPPMLLHPVDFISLLMLKRTLPDADKKIEICWEDKREKVEALVGCSLNKLVIVHVGTGAPEKTRLFPEEYCVKLMKEMAYSGLTVAAFATTDHRSHATRVPEGVINLVDKLDWNEFCTLIAHSRVLVTNDSSPVHLASMFDNYLIVIPTVKHPDRLIHFRQGHRYFKAFALYNKLMFDDTLVHPERVVARFDWTGIDEHRDEYLPSPYVVAQRARDCFLGAVPAIGGINV